jgi:uncharacterized membrane protein YciS (DUF1049 family)
MFNLILLVLVALGFGYFSTQNTLTIPLVFGPYALTNIPLYTVVGITLLIGLLLAWVISLLSSLATAMNLRDKEKAIREHEDTIQALTKRVNELQIENANLKGELKSESTDELTL